MPDAGMLLKLSSALDCQFTDVDAAQAIDVGGETVSSPVEGASDLPAPERKRPTRRRAVVLIIAAAVLCAAAVLMALHSRAPKPRVYTSEDGSTYTVEQFQQTTPRVDGKPWMNVEKVLKISSSDGVELWMYDFIFHEMNGVGLKVDSVEYCHFVGDTAFARVFSGESLPQYGMENVVAGHGEWRTTGGLPVQESVSGVGITLYCTDDNGEEVSSSSYLALDAK